MFQICQLTWASSLTLGLVPPQMWVTAVQGTAPLKRPLKWKQLMHSSYWLPFWLFFGSVEVLFIFPFLNFSTSTRQSKQTRKPAPTTSSLYWQPIHEQEVFLAGKKATAEALLDLQTFVTNGVSSLTLSCLTKTNPHSEQHPSVLVENNDRLPFCCTQSIWILSLLPLFYLW